MNRESKDPRQRRRHRARSGADGGAGRLRQRARLHRRLPQAHDGLQQLRAASTRVDRLAGEASATLAGQREGIPQVAPSMAEMESSVSEVSRSTESAAANAREAMEEAVEEAVRTDGVVSDSRNQVGDAARQIATSHALREESVRLGH